MTFVEQYTRILGNGREACHEYLFHCPFPDCRGNPDPKFYVDPQTGAWYCQRCQYTVPGKEVGGGTWKDFIRLVNDEENAYLWVDSVGEGKEKPEPLGTKERRIVWTRMFEVSKLMKDHAHHIHQRGLDPEGLGLVSAGHLRLCELVMEFGDAMIERAGLQRRDANEENGWVRTLCIYTDRILIPFFLNDQVDHFIGYSPTSEIKYAGPAGYTPQIYGEIPKDCELLIITEGQLKAAAAIQRGYPCVGLQGMGQQHRKVATQCVKQGVKRAVVLFDTQSKGQELVDHEADRLGRELLKKGISAFRARLPLDKGESKQDVDQFLLQHSLGQFDEILKEALQTPYQFESVT